MGLRPPSSSETFPCDEGLGVLDPLARDDTCSLSDGHLPPDHVGRSASHSSGLGVSSGLAHAHTSTGDDFPIPGVGFGHGPRRGPRDGVAPSSSEDYGSETSAFTFVVMRLTEIETSLHNLAREPARTATAMHLIQESLSGIRTEVREVLDSVFAASHELVTLLSDKISVSETVVTHHLARAVHQDIPESLARSNALLLTLITDRISSSETSLFARLSTLLDQRLSTPATARSSCPTLPAALPTVPDHAHPGAYSGLGKDPAPHLTMPADLVPLAVHRDLPSHARPVWPKLEEYPKFSGAEGEDHRLFAQRVDNLRSVYSLPDIEILKKLGSILIGKAAPWYEDRMADGNIPTTWDEWKTTIFHHFETDSWHARQHEEFTNMSFTGGDATTWVSRFGRLMRIVIPGVLDSAIQKAIIRRVSREFGSALQTRAGSSPLSMTEFSAIFEDVASVQYPRSSRRFPAPSARPLHRAQTAPPRDLTPREGGQHPVPTMATPPARVPLGAPTRTARGCYNCGMEGHMSRECPQPRKINMLGQDPIHDDDEYEDASPTGPAEDAPYSGDEFEDSFQVHALALDSSLDHLCSQLSTHSIQKDDFLQAMHSLPCPCSDFPHTEGFDHTSADWSGDSDPAWRWASHLTPWPDVPILQLCFLPWKSTSAHGISSLALEGTGLLGDLDVSSIGASTSSMVHRHFADAGMPVELDRFNSHQFATRCPTSDASAIAQRPTRGKAHQTGLPVNTFVIMNGVPIQLCLDTGAGPSVIDEGFLAKLDPLYGNKMIPIAPRRFKAFGSTLSPSGVYEAKIVFPHPAGNLRLLVEFVVIPAGTCPTTAILGNDYLALYGFNFSNSRGRYFSIGNSKQKFQPCGHGQLSPAVSVPSDVATYGSSIATLAPLPPVSAALPTPPPVFPSPLHLPPASPPSQGPEPLPPPGAPTPDPAAFERAIDEMHFGPSLSSDEVLALKEVIRDYPMAFAHGSHQLGNPQGHCCRIDLNSETELPPKIRQAPYPASPRTREEMHKNIQELLDMGVIRKSNSKFAAPAIIVTQGPKARLCVNYKVLNGVTKGDSYPMPRVDAAIHSLKGSKFFTGLDANKGFHQISLCPEHIERTAFATPFGLYEYLRMPFGLKNAPAIFQRAMDDTFHRQLLEAWLRIYIDDLLLNSVTFEDHLRRLRIVLSLLESAGWTLAPSKCRFAFEDIYQLGHHLSGILVGVDNNKVAAVAQFRQPRNVKDVQGYLGFTGYYRKFIKEYATLARPLSRLLTKDVVFEWTTACQSSFEALRQALLSAPVLAQPDFNLPFRLYIDACGQGLGAVLQQEQDRDGTKTEVVICYISRQLRGAEERYGATQLECLALVWALEKLHLFLDGAEFEVITDCIAIKSLLNMETPNRHMLRWQLAIQEYRGRMSIVHREGRAHANADVLSRWALPNDDSNPAADLSPNPEPVIHALSVCDLSDEFFNTILESYDSDPDFHRITRALADPTVDPAFVSSINPKIFTDFTNGRFFLLDKLLYRREGSSAALVICDLGTHGAIISACHDGVTSGHFGVEKTWERIRNIAWWPGIYGDVEAYCKSCLACQRGSRRPGKSFGLAQRIEKPTYPWQLINMDFVTGFPPGGAEGYNSVLVVVDRYSRRVRFLLTFKDADAKFTAKLFYREILSQVGVPEGIISDRDKLFTSQFWRSLADICGFKLKLSTSYHPQTDGLAERAIGTFEDCLRRFVSFSPSWTDDSGFQHDWTDLLPGLEFAVNSAVNSSTKKTPFELERGHNPRSIYDMILDRAPHVRADPGSDSFTKMLAASNARAQECVDEAVLYAAKRWDATHIPSPFTVGSSAMISTKHFRFGGPGKLIPPFVGPFGVTRLVGPNAIEVKLTGPYAKKHPVFPVSLAKLYQPGDPQRFPGRRQAPAPDPIIVENEAEWIIESLLEERTRRGRGRNSPAVHEFLVKWEGWDDSHNLWLPESELGNAKELLAEFRFSQRA